MFRSNAMVKHVETTLENTLYAEAEFITNADLDHAELELGDEGLHSRPLGHVKAGRYIFKIYGGDTIPFRVDDTIQVLCWPKGEFPTGIEEHKES